MARILLVDDDLQSLASTARILELAGHGVIEARDGQEALTLIRETQSRTLSPFDVVISDVRMPKLGGIEFLRAIGLLGETTPVILMTAFGQVDEAVWAMKLGAVDFLTKPFKRQSLLDALEMALKRRPKSSGEIRSEAAESAGNSGLLGSSAAISGLRVKILQVAPTDATVLLRGPSGCGKELAAREIHRLSRRAGGAFIALNCAAIPDELIESELFGFEKGSFTGAGESKKGLFEAAEGGTLFLDEIGDMPLQLQATLLRALQEREIRRLGATVARKVDVRVISATHRDLSEAVRAGSFREDLLFRLEVVGLQVPTLAERAEDIPLLVREFLAQVSLRHGKRVRELAPEVERVLAVHSWPGNVRELFNVIERAVIFSDGERISLSDLPAHLIRLAEEQTPGAPGSAVFGSAISVPFGTPLREVEDLLIRKTLEATSGDKGMTAKLLGINSRTIYRKLESGKQPEKNGVRERPEGASAEDNAAHPPTADIPTSP